MANESMDRWKGRVALVTGASSGIGKAVAERLARAGMKVAIAARRKERLEQLAADHGQAMLPVQVDLRDEASILAMFDAVRERWGGVDVMVNNAGLGHAMPLTRGDTEKWREMLEVNVLALCVCTQEAVQDMLRREVDGHVVHMASMASHRVPRGSGVYSATKYAVKALTEGLRQELRQMGSPIRVSEISPGLAETEFHAVFHASEDKARETYSQLKVLEADDVAAAVEYVLSVPPHVQVHDVWMRPTEQVS